MARMMPLEPYTIAEEVTRLKRIGDSDKELLKFLRAIPWEWATPYYRHFFQPDANPLVLVEGTRKIWVLKGTWPKPKTDVEKAYQINVFDEFIMSFLDKINSIAVWEQLDNKEFLSKTAITYSRICAEIVFS